MYWNIDIAKNVLSTSNCVTSIIKTKRKREDKQVNDNNNNSGVVEVNKVKGINNEKVKEDNNEKINNNEDIEMKDVLS
jgi:hypothetical protein